MLRGLTRGLGELLITVGALLLLFVTWQLWWTDVQAGQAQSAVTADLRDAWHNLRHGQTPAGAAPSHVVPAPETPPVPSAQPVDFGPPPPPVEAGAGTAFAILHVPRFGPDYQRPVLQGTSLNLLDRGVGHYQSSAMPGQVGNFALAGHRVTYGRPFHDIADLRPGDPVVIETSDAWYVYRMRSNLVVTPDRVDVVAPTPEQPGVEPTERLLTMTACHPMYSARERFVVHAVLERWQPKSAGEPAEIVAAG